MCEQLKLYEVVRLVRGERLPVNVHAAMLVFVLLVQIVEDGNVDSNNSFHGLVDAECYLPAFFFGISLVGEDRGLVLEG